MDMAKSRPNRRQRMQKMRATVTGSPTFAYKSREFSAALLPTSQKSAVGSPATLADGFVQADSAGDRHIEAFDRTLHGNTHERVTGLACQLAHAIALGT